MLVRTHGTYHGTLNPEPAHVNNEVHAVSGRIIPLQIVVNVHTIEANTRNPHFPPPS
ncbi:hypothetical protein D3C75_1300140 [compost metagenome]